MRRGTKHEALTPRKVLLLALVETYLTNTWTASSAEEEQEPPQQPPSEADKYLLGRFLAEELERGGADGCAEEGYQVTRQRLYDQMGEELAERIDMFLHEKLTELTNSPDDLYLFFQSLALLFDEETAATVLEPTSTLGMFVRRMLLAFRKGSFTTLSRLFSNLEQYLHSPPPPPPEEPEAIPEGEPTFLVPFDSAFIQRKLKHLKEDFGRVPQSLIQQELEQLKAMASSSFAFSSSAAFDNNQSLDQCHYLSYLNSLYHRDYSGSIDHLHRYFDLCLHDNDEHTALHLLQLQQPPQQASNASTDSSSTMPSAPPTTVDPSVVPIAGKSMVPYAVLNLALTHFYFGEVEAAKLALFEAVQVAQERADDECLAYAFYWLSRVLEVEENSSSSSLQRIGGVAIREVMNEIREDAERASKDLRQVIQRLVARAQSLRLHSLRTLGLLALAKYDLLHPRHTPTLAIPTPSTSSRSIKVSDLKALVDAGTDEASIGHAQSSLLNSAHMLTSDMWRMFGHKELEILPIQAHLQLYQDKARGEESCQAFCKLALWHSEHGNLAKAFGALVEAQELYPVAIRYNEWTETTLHILHDWCLRRGEYLICEEVEQRLNSLAAVSCQGNASAKAEAIFRKARRLAMSSVKLQEAVDIVCSLLTLCDEANLMIPKVGYLLCLGEIYVRGGHTIEALPYVLSCLTQCENYHLHDVGARATMLLAEIHLRLGNDGCGGGAFKALELLESILPQVMRHCPLFVKAEHLLLQAKCKLAIAHPHDREELAAVLELLGRAMQAFTRLQAIEQQMETSYLQARLHHQLGDNKTRNDASRLFKQLCQRKANAQRERWAHALLSNERRAESLAASLQAALMQEEWV
ncbi:Anaphase-promoting complex subunit 5 [Balamuthia mandrillaris]